MRERWQIERDRLIAEIAVNEEHTRKRNELREELDDLSTAQDLEALYASEDERLEDMRKQLDSERRDARWGRR